mmetsp:Transcript_20004/g.27525  ORF Transcript_20004/g.27525 Transcript_20004/m.27525 type:complete len:912 (+) Transcript_20004:97-2832(+)|eukprot:CAMPEP_0201477058 /NCGR_PEP_ID=MMETSP0151_2-20130828/2177_1 /ASSEMBLY_ACC=CAM_ASM_000257 /TAXON_ID=200890 /ORGANISM="Paramoeba atlantica, Strain 621/1 / CCAP 1560/9" /LENGTH=911 /DNA_ID=CAMNT_0047857671 /DNA_START=91 /DNA_END=2826 /DNA_ORIENTATION=-
MNSLYGIENLFFKLGLFLFVASSLVTGQLINSGSPTDIQEGFDCAARQFAYEYGQQLLPSRGDFRTLFDALQLEFCGMDPPPQYDQWTPPVYPLDSRTSAVFVSPSGNDGNSGSITSPFKTIDVAVKQCASLLPPCVVNLREGTYPLSAPVEIDVDSLVLQNYNGENAVLSGAVKFELGEWEDISVRKPLSDWVQYDNDNNVYGDAISEGSTDQVFYLGKFGSADSCASAASQSKIHFTSWTYHSSQFEGDFAQQCFGRIGGVWKPHYQELVTSGTRDLGMNVWKTQVLNPVEGVELRGLRVNGSRGIRARYPNANPETAMQYDPLNGYIISDTQWNPHQPKPEPTVVVITSDDYPGVEWPMDMPSPTSDWTGEGDWGEYHVAMNGTCDDVTPSFGYWCTNGPRDVRAHYSPSGMSSVDSTILPHGPYDSSGGFVFAWYPYHWYTWMFSVENSSQTNVNFGKGGNQGGEGEDFGGEWYIENILQELDWPGEYYYDSQNQTLFYFHNDTSASPPFLLQFEGVYYKKMIEVTGVSMDQPLRNVTIRGITIRDTAYHYMDDLGLPSGGDWALHRGGAIFLENTEGVTIENVYMTKIDGNGIFISGYNRGTVVRDSEFAWLGESAIASWGYTTSDRHDFPEGEGPDGTTGSQPRHTYVKGNLVREIGLWQKQSSFYFQATSCLNVIEGNVVFNGPRAGINFNDGFGGGNVIAHNLLLNTCRESGDHGPFNGWDRVPYITKVRNGEPSIIPANNEIHHNFFISNYQAYVPVDTDDGCSYFDVHHNFFVYGDFGLKSDFGGHDHYDHDNIYAFNGNAYGTGIPDIGGNFDSFYHNRFIARAGRCSDFCYGSTCPDTALPDMEVYDNMIYTEDATAHVCGMSFDNWQAGGNDVMTTIDYWPPNDVIIQWGRELLMRRN